MEKLVCIITGPEHSGTTYLKNILESHPYIYSGFETGILIDDDFSKSIPWKNWITEGEYHWGLPKNIDLTQNNLTINDKYRILFNNKGSYNGINQKLIKNSKYLIDKTPMYFSILPDVYKRLNNKNIPIIITIKYFQAYYTSICAKRKNSEDFLLHKIKKYIEIMKWLYKYKKIYKNIYLFLYDDIKEKENKFINKLKKIISSRININYIISYKKYEEKLKNNKICESIDINTNKSWEKSILKEVPFHLKLLEMEYDSLIDDIKYNL